MKAVSGALGMEGIDMGLQVGDGEGWCGIEWDGGVEWDGLRYGVG